MAEAFRFEAMANNENERVRIKTRLTRDRVNSYWKRLGISQRTWEENYTLPERYELVISDLLNKLDDGETGGMEKLEP